MDEQNSVLFVCLGNTCRSTMAEGIFLHLVEQRGQHDKWHIDSAGIANWHEGKPPDEYTLFLLHQNDMLNSYHHAARQIQEADFKKFQYILCMDNYNIECLERIVPADCTAKVQLLGSYDINGEDPQIYDPYMAAIEVFEEVFKKCLRCCTRFLDTYSTSP